MSYKVFYTDESTNYGKGSTERHPIHRACEDEFDSVEEATKWIVQKCLRSSCKINLFRIFHECEISTTLED